MKCKNREIKLPETDEPNLENAKITKYQPGEL